MTSPNEETIAYHIVRMMSLAYANPCVETIERCRGMATTLWCMDLITSYRYKLLTQEIDKIKEKC